ncbi:uncharacterized protein PFL1_02108 [Pseudozyma flocculosa PF-1]|uniref:Phospholipid scramblase n=1 Tax=Pseudozyma flocculosa TaxID=84751 RepID=A0A5C3F2K5_9BASI|nr:uncharacterized protein PFL1_02108 [Pseudozyma flocculosa PF-1]EPQ30584.1 hypothetical protein PFL1_02108 [Pseudozyma flocculosa PF-1]SPO37679.1 uncharacterized protein PSFLO_03155 [Pseudozyma flocculosa]
MSSAPPASTFFPHDISSSSTASASTGQRRGYVARHSSGGGRFLRHGRSHLPGQRPAAPPGPGSSQQHPDPVDPDQRSTIDTEPRQKDPATGAETAPVPVDPAVYTEAVIPREPRDVLQPDDPNFEGASRLLGQSALVVTREIEMMNIFLGYEQANRYSIVSPTGEQVGFLTEEETGFLGGAMKRQLLRTHRPFRATVMNAEGRPVLMIKRPLTYINSKTSVYAVRPDYPIGSGPPGDDDLALIGEVQQRWHVYRRRYELFLRRPPSDDGDDAAVRSSGGDGDDHFEQFAQIDAGLWSWSFLMQDADERLVGAIDRNFRGFAREIFTDTGAYVVRFDSVGQTDMTDPRIAASQPGQPGPASESESSGTALVESQGTRPLTLDERAVALATAVSIDFDYFSRHSSHASGGGGMFPWFYMGGGGAEAGEAGAGGATGGQPPTAPPPQQQDDGGFGLGSGMGMGGSMGQTDYPYDPSQSGSGSDTLPRQTPPESYGDAPPSPPSTGQDVPWWEAAQQQQQQGGVGDGSDGGGDVWGTGSSDPWAGADDTEFGDGDGGDGGGGGGLFGSWTDWLPSGDD